MTKVLLFTIKKYNLQATIDLINETKKKGKVLIDLFLIYYFISLMSSRLIIVSF